MNESDVYISELGIFTSDFQLLDLHELYNMK